MAVSVYLDGQRKLFPLENFGIIDPEEIRIQNSLYHACHVRNGITICILREVAIYPIWDVQCTIYPQSEDIMCGDCFCLACSLQHEELG